MRNPYNLGFKAGKDQARYGYRPVKNPYTQDDPDHDEWDRGYEEGYEEGDMQYQEAL